MDWMLLQLQARMRNSHTSNVPQAQSQQNRARLPKPMIGLDKESRQEFRLLLLRFRGQHNLALPCARLQRGAETCLASLSAIVDQAQQTADRQLHDTGKVFCTLVYFCQPRHPLCTAVPESGRDKYQVSRFEKNAAWMDVLCQEEQCRQSAAVHRSQAESSPYCGLICQGIIGASVYVIIAWRRTFVHFF